MGTEIKYCKMCAESKIEHDFQDTKYGKYHRVFNTSEKSAVATCTICNSGKKTKK